MGHAVIAQFTRPGAFCRNTHVKARGKQVDTKSRNCSGNESTDRRAEERLDHLGLGLVLQHRWDAGKCGSGQPEGADKQV